VGGHLLLVAVEGAPFLGDEQRIVPVGVELDDGEWRPFDGFRFPLARVVVSVRRSVGQ